MPKYNYKCPECALRWEAWGAMKGTPPPCPSCGFAHGEKVPSIVYVVNKEKKAVSKAQKTGQITKDHIEENREILKKMKKQIREKGK